MTSGRSHVSLMTLLEASTKLVDENFLWSALHQATGTLLHLISKDHSIWDTGPSLLITPDTFLLYSSGSVLFCSGVPDNPGSDFSPPELALSSTGWNKTTVVKAYVYSLGSTFTNALDLLECKVNFQELKDLSNHMTAGSPFDRPQLSHVMKTCRAHLEGVKPSLVVGRVVRRAVGRNSVESISSLLSTSDTSLSSSHSNTSAHSAGRKDSFYSHLRRSSTDRSTGGGRNQVEIPVLSAKEWTSTENLMLDRERVLPSQPPATRRKRSSIHGSYSTGLYRSSSSSSTRSEPFNFEQPTTSSSVRRVSAKYSHGDLPLTSVTSTHIPSLSSQTYGSYQDVAAVTTERTILPSMSVSMEKISNIRRTSGEYSFGKDFPLFMYSPRKHDLEADDAMEGSRMANTPSPGSEDFTEIDVPHESSQPPDDLPTSTPPLEDPPTSTPPPEDLPTGSLPPEDPPTNTPPPEVLPTSTPPPEDPPTSTPPPEDLPTSTPPPEDPPTSVLPLDVFGPSEQAIQRSDSHENPAYYRSPMVGTNTVEEAEELLSSREVPSYHVDYTDGNMSVDSPEPPLDSVKTTDGRRKGNREITVEFFLTTPEKKRKQDSTSSSDELLMMQEDRQGTGGTSFTLWEPSPTSPTTIPTTSPTMSPTMSPTKSSTRIYATPPITPPTRVYPLHTTTPPDTPPTTPPTGPPVTTPTPPSTEPPAAPPTTPPPLPTGPPPLFTPYHPQEEFSFNTTEEIFNDNDIAVLDGINDSNHDQEDENAVVTSGFLRCDTPPPLPTTLPPVETPSKPMADDRVFGGRMVDGESVDGPVDGPSLHESDQEVNTLDQEVSKFDQEGSKLDQEVSKLDQEGSKLDQKGSKLDQEVSKLDQEVSKLDQEVSKLDQEGSRLDQEVSEIATEQQSVLLKADLPGVAMVTSENSKPTSSEAFASESDKEEDSLEAHSKHEKRSLLIESPVEDYTVVDVDKAGIYSTVVQQPNSEVPSSLRKSSVSRLVERRRTSVEQIQLRDHTAKDSDYDIPLDVLKRYRDSAEAPEGYITYATVTGETKQTRHIQVKLEKGGPQVSPLEDISEMSGEHETEGNRDSVLSDDVSPYETVTRGMPGMVTSMMSIASGPYETISEEDSDGPRPKAQARQEGSFDKVNWLLGPDYSKLHRSTSIIIADKSSRGVARGRRVVSVVLLDSRIMEILVEHDSCGRDVHDQVSAALSLEEPYLFGLAVVKGSAREEYFLELNKKLEKYAPKNWVKRDALPPQSRNPHSQPQEFIVLFRIMYYISRDMIRKVSTSTRYHLCLQLRKDILSGKLFVTRERAVVFGALLAALERASLSDTKDLSSFVPESLLGDTHNQEMLNELKSYKETLAHLSPDELRILFLMEATTLEDYGVMYYGMAPGKLQPLGSYLVGISVGGVTIQTISETQRIILTDLSWKDIDNVYFKNRKFVVEPHDSQPVVLYGGDYRRARYLWNLVVLFHRFSVFMRQRCTRLDTQYVQDGVKLVRLLKKSGQGIGLRIGSNSNGVFVKHIYAGGPADVDGQLETGDRVVSVNGETVHAHQQASDLIKSGPLLVSLLVEKVLVERRPTPNELDSSMEVVRRTSSVIVAIQPTIPSDILEGEEHRGHTHTNTPTLGSTGDIRKELSDPSTDDRDVVSSHTGSGEATPTQTGDSETTPTQTRDSETTPTQTGDSETTPTQTRDSETTPTQTGDSQITSTLMGDREATPTQTSDNETTPTQARNTETTPTQTRNTETIPTQTRNMETTPTHTEDRETTPTQTRNTETTPTHAEDRKTTPTQTRNTETTPTHAEDRETTPTQTRNTETTPTHAEDRETTPTHAEDRETTSMHTEDKETTPIQTRSTETTPTQTRTAETTPTQTRNMETIPTHTEDRETTPTQTDEISTPIVNKGSDEVDMSMSEKTVKVTRHPTRQTFGLMFKIKERRVLVKTIDSTCPAAHCGLKIGQEVVSINGTRVQGRPLVQIVDIMSHSLASAEIVVKDSS